MKNRKAAEKRQSAAFSEVSFEIVKDPEDFTLISQISGPISDSEAESIIKQGSGLDLLSTPEICFPTEESTISTITSMEAHSSTNQIHSTVDLRASVQSLRSEINNLKSLIHSVETSGESNWTDGIVAMKFRIVLLSFIIWVFLAALVVLFSSGREEITYYGPHPT